MFSFWWIWNVQCIQTFFHSTKTWLSKSLNGPLNGHRWGRVRQGVIVAVPRLPGHITELLATYQTWYIRYNPKILWSIGQSNCCLMFVRFGLSIIVTHNQSSFGFTTVECFQCISLVASSLSESADESLFSESSTASCLERPWTLAKTALWSGLDRPGKSCWSEVSNFQNWPHSQTSVVWTLHV